jgi:enterochelin esterase-like enzyme
MLLLICFALSFTSDLKAQQAPIQELIESARSGPAAPGLTDKITTVLSAKGGTAVWGQDFLFVADSPSQATISIDQQPAVAMSKVEGSTFWIFLKKMRTGVTHSYQYYADSKALGNRGDAIGYNPDSYPKPGVPHGRVSDKLTITSHVYEGMKVDYWVYASPGVDPAVPAALMVWQDGAGLVGDYSRSRLFTVTENLVQQKLLPPMVYVLISPGIAPDGKSLRSIEYDTVSDRYLHFLANEVLPEVSKMYKLRPDGYSRAIGGDSSGGICAFNAAWLRPDLFSRVHSGVGSFTSIQWRPDEKQEGGNIYPFKVRKEAKRNIRVWMSDGGDDLENDHGSWPMQNIQMANSLKLKEYDFHFRFGTAAHGNSQTILDLPESLTWLWRDYDPAKTTQNFQMDPAEKEKPFFRVTIANRDAW